MNSSLSSAATPALRLSERWRQQIIYVTSLLGALGLWEIAARAGLLDVRFFPAPVTILSSMGQMLGTGELTRHISATVGRILIGFTLGAVPAILLGLLMGLSATARAAVQPLIDATFPVPKIAILPLLILLLGAGEASKYALIAIAVFYLVLINTIAGVRGIEPIYRDVGRSYAATRRMWLLDIALPGALPMIMAGARLGMGVALLVIVSAEFVGARSGIGYLIWTSWQVFDIARMYVGLFLSAAIGLLIGLIMDAIERLVVPWKQAS